MAKVYAVGPCGIYVRLSSGILFLGHSERGPRVMVRPQYSPIYCDLFGPSVPADIAFAGEDAIISVDLTRWNESVYLRLSDKVNHFGVPGIGRNDPGEIGTMMVSEGAAYPVFVHFPHSAKPAYADQPAGLRFAACVLETDNYGALGTGGRKMNLVFHAYRTLDLSVANIAGRGRLLLYDHNMAGLPAID